METLALAASMRQIIQERLFSQKIKMCGEELPSLTVSNLKLLTVHGRSVAYCTYCISPKNARKTKLKMSKNITITTIFIYFVHRLLLVPPVGTVGTCSGLWTLDDTTYKYNTTTAAHSSQLTAHTQHCTYQV